MGKPLTGRPKTVNTSTQTPTATPAASARDDHGTTALAAAGGLLGALGALGAASCCILPLLLFSLGAGGAWLGRLAVLSPYQPLFLTLAAGSLGYGFYRVYRRPRGGCPPAGPCARPLPGRLVKACLWLAAAVTAAALAFPYLASLYLAA